ncbi:MAG: ribosome biogenesis GTPase Der [Rickettsiales bacterium]|nr:ribosome biogenesis GTPase Der [Rickettsiales bacterium]
MYPKIAIIGRTNVGKSTIFNKLIKKKLAITSNTPGVTRDRNESDCQILDRKFTLIDTAGYETEGTDYHQNIIEQIHFATKHSDLCLFVIDVKIGVTTLDREFAQLIRKKNLKTILILNKAENLSFSDIYLDDIYKLGFKNYILFSAEHNQGFIDLYEMINQEIDFSDYEQDENDDDDQSIKLAIIGRPNVGKSTFINTLIGEKRLVTADQPGVTRDSIKVNFDFQNQKYQLIDTAGIRRKLTDKEKIEKFSVDESYRTIRLSHVIIFLIDATCYQFVKQDLALIKHCIEEGRVVLVAINKWDLMQKCDLVTYEELENHIHLELDHIKSHNLLKISALQKSDVEKVMRQVVNLYKKWNYRVSTGQLNNLLRDLVIMHPPKLYKGKPIKLKYITQAKARPPTFVVNCNYPEKLGDDYIRYLKNSTSDILGFDNIPIRLKLKKSKNPYEKRK